RTKCQILSEVPEGRTGQPLTARNDCFGSEGSRIGSQRRTTGIVKGFGCRPVVTYPVLRAGVRKPPRKEPAGPGGRSAAYGDLVGQELRRVMSWPALLTADWRRRSKIGRRCCTRRSDLGAIAGLASGSAGAGMKSVRRRERDTPAGG